jgi:hypothetical protein
MVFSLIQSPHYRPERRCLKCRRRIGNDACLPATISKMARSTAPQVAFKGGRVMVVLWQPGQTRAVAAGSAGCAAPSSM